MNAQHRFMGIQDLWPFLQKLAPHAFSPVSKEMIEGKVVAVDAAILIHRSVHRASSVQFEPVMDEFLGLLRNLESRGVEPLVVFDGGRR
jgi:hypothetical protein